MNAGAHPLQTNQAQLITPQMVRVLQLVINRVAARRSALLFHGLSLVGKSRCSVFVHEHFKDNVPDVFAMYHIALYRESGRRQSVMKELCASEKALPAGRGVDYFQHLLAYIEGQVTGQPAPHCVLVVDEIQYWLPSDLHVVAGLHNYLRSRGIQLTVVGFAQAKLIAHRVNGLRAVEHDHIVARFFSEILEFKGCESVDELTVILQGCDEGSEYPVGSGISYTAFFVPEAFAAGFRLAHLADWIWRAFEGEVKGQYADNFPMQHVREAILYLLQFMAPHDSALFEADEQMVEAAVKCTGVAVFCHV